MLGCLYNMNKNIFSCFLLFELAYVLQVAFESPGLGSNARPAPVISLCLYRRSIQRCYYIRCLLRGETASTTPLRFCGIYADS